MAETPSGMLNSIGLQGPGIDAFCAKDLPWLVDHGARAVVSIAGGSVEEYVKLAHKLRDAPGVGMIEVNISCPNVERPRPGVRLRSGGLGSGAARGSPGGAGLASRSSPSSRRT